MILNIPVLVHLHKSLLSTVLLVYLLNGCCSMCIKAFTDFIIIIILLLEYSNI